VDPEGGVESGEDGLGQGAEAKAAQDEAEAKAMSEHESKALEAIKNGHVRFRDIMAAVSRLYPEVTRGQVDRALQKLREKGEIKFQAGCWKIPDTKQEG
jgi:hypothetical protein